MLEFLTGTGLATSAGLNAYIKHQRAIVGASLDVIKERRSQRPEARAAAHLESLGRVIVARNYRIPGGEIDLVTREPDGTGAVKRTLLEP